MQVSPGQTLDPARLLVFVAVAEELHFGRASERLHIAQPALSRTIKALESELGCSLFIRTTRRVELTPHGVALLEPARSVLDTIRAARNAVHFASRGLSGRLRVGYPGPSASPLIAKLTKLILQELPGIDLVLRSGVFGYDAARALLRDELDFALMRWNSRPVGIGSRIIGADRHVVILPTEHRLAKARAARLREFEKENWITLAAEGSPLTESFWGLCRKAGFIPRITTRAPDAWTAMSLVEEGVGVSFNYESTVRNARNPGVSMVLVEDVDRFSYSRLGWRADDTSPLIRNILALSSSVLPALDLGPVSPDAFEGD
jgi:DNA-binding transcriptional LysR family regulator